MANLPTCYFPSGTSSPDTPCHSDNGASACCAHTDTCLSNGLCLAQGGSELISRGSCTDESWQSPECPQHCSDVNIGGGALIFLAGYIQDQFLFCCSQLISSNNTCATATRGSYAPFSLEAGQVIVNRTSGSTSTNIANAATVTKTATVTETATFTVPATATVTVITSPSTSPPILRTSPSCSSREAAVGAGLGVTLGLALLVTLGFLWRQRKHKQSLRTDVQTWEWRYNELTTKVVTLSGAEQQRAIHQLPGWSPDELDGRPKPFPSEMADKPI